MVEKKELDLGVDSRSLGGSSEPGEPDLNRIRRRRLGEGPEVEVRRAPHGTTISDPQRRERDELAGLKSIELRLDVLRDLLAATRHPREVIRGPILSRST